MFIHAKYDEILYCFQQNDLLSLQDNYFSPPWFWAKLQVITGTLFSFRIFESYFFTHCKNGTIKKT